MVPGRQDEERKSATSAKFPRTSVTALKGSPQNVDTNIPTPRHNTDFITVKTKTTHFQVIHREQKPE